MDVSRDPEGEKEEKDQGLRVECLHGLGVAGEVSDPVR